MNEFALDLEYRLTIAMRMSHDCSCARYLIDRKEVLIPKIMQIAKKNDKDPVEVFVQFQSRVHANHQMQ